MYYLIRPDLSAQWTSDDDLLQPRSGTVEEFRDARREALSFPLEWKPAEKPVTDEAVAIALRHGISTPDGIIVEFSHLASSRQRDEIIRTHEAARAAAGHPTIRATDEFIDAHLAPGWIAAGEQNATELDEGVRESVARHQRKVDALLAAPLNDELVTHWRKLGGTVPTDVGPRA